MRIGVIAAVAAAGLFVGCAAQKKEQAAPAPEKAPPKKVRITNYNSFDLGTCFPAKIDVPKEVTPEVLTGLLLTARADLDECFVDPANRGKGEVTKAVLGATVDASGVQYKIDGGDLTPGAKACLESALKTHLADLAPLGATAKPVSAEIDYQHDASASPAVTLGINEASDVVAMIRIAQKQWCDCYEPWRAKAPASFEGELSLPKESTTPRSVTFAPGADEDTAKVQACLDEKLRALTPAHTADLTVPLKFVFIHTGISEPLPNAPADLAALQREGVRTRDRAGEQIALGGRAAAANAWNAIVTKYSANPKAFTMKQLRAGCAALESADRALLTAQERFRDDEQQSLEWMRAQAGADLHDAISASEQELARLAASLEQTRAQQAQDAATCSKLK